MMKEDLSNVFKALGHPVRLEIIRRLIGQVQQCCEKNKDEQCNFEAPVCKYGGLVEELNINKATLSNHLKELRYAGLIDTIKHGRRVSIQVNLKRLEEVQQFLELGVDQQTEKWMTANAGA